MFTDCIWYSEIMTIKKSVDENEKVREKNELYNTMGDCETNS